MSTKTQILIYIVVVAVFDTIIPIPITAPKYRQVVIGDDGYPAAMVCPDPRCFALHKIWMGTQSDRDPVKKQRDRHQAITVAYLVHTYLPQHKFAASELRMFPKAIFDAATAEIASHELPPGFE